MAWGPLVTWLQQRLAPVGQRPEVEGPAARLPFKVEEKALVGRITWVRDPKRGAIFRPGSWFK